jgi:hypothetical protein
MTPPTTELDLRSGAHTGGIGRGSGVTARVPTSTAPSGRRPLPRVKAPAARSLATVGVTSLDDLTRFAADDLLILNGFGPKLVDRLRVVLAEHGLSLRE